MSWTSERVDLLKKLWLDGLSASQIAAELGGVTRNAVIGKVHRLGLSGRAKAPAAPAKARKTTRPANGDAQPSAPTETGGSAPQTVGATALKVEATPAPAPVEKPRAEVVPIAKRASILTLTERTCKWPIGDPTKDDFYFCGNSSEPGVPYCPYHCRIAYQPANDRRRDRSSATG